MLFRPRPFDCLIALSADFRDDFIDQRGIICRPDRHRIADFVIQSPAFEIELEMARIPFRTFAAQTAIDRDFCRKQIRLAYTARAFDSCQSGSDLTVVADRECWTNFHRTLRRGGLGVACGLLGKINSRFVFVRFQKRRRFFKASAAHRASGVDVPGSGNIERLLTVLVGHASRCTKSKRDLQLFRRRNGAAPLPCRLGKASVGVKARTAVFYSRDDFLGFSLNIAMSTRCVGFLPGIVRSTS